MTNQYIRLEGTHASFMRCLLIATGVRAAGRTFDDSRTFHMLPHRSGNWLLILSGLRAAGHIFHDKWLRAVGGVG